MLGQLVAHVRRDETTRIIRQVRRVRRIDILREQLLGRVLYGTVDAENDWHVVLVDGELR
jgi:hypothetical protein